MDLFQLHRDGSIWVYMGPPMTGWQMLDNNQRTRAIAASRAGLYQLHDDGSIWVYTGPGVIGWQMLDNNHRTKAIAASSAGLYQLHDDGTIWRYTGPPMTGWQMLDNNPATTAMVVADADIHGRDNLYQLRSDGSIWLYTGPPMTGWQMLDNNQRTRAITVGVAGSIDGTGNLYQLHDDGTIWRYMGPPVTGWQMLDNNRKTKAIAVSGYPAGVHQLHDDGSIWVYTGTPVVGWQMLDHNPRARAITESASGGLHQLHDDGSIWRYTGIPMAGWQMLDNNPATTVILGSQLPVPNLLDLVWSSVDPNGLPLNPKLGWQVRRQYGSPDYYPDVGCALKPAQPWTGQITSTDSGFGCVNQAHVNWMPVTYEGYIKWSSHSASTWPFGDDDYNMYLFTPEGAGASRRTDGNDGGIQVEFDAGETIDHFHTAWWNQFHSNVDNGNGGVINDKRSIVTALWGLDLEHGGQSELHPAYALAMLVNDDPNDDQWAMFVRTWGDEGYCSGQLYWLPLPTAPNGWKIYRFRLPWRPGAAGVNWDDNDFLGRTDFSIDVTPTVNEGVVVTFAFFQGTGDQAPRINGTLHFHWVGAAGAYPVLDGAALTNVQRATGVKVSSTSNQIQQGLQALAPDVRDRAMAELAAIAPAPAVTYDTVARSGAAGIVLSAVQPLGIADLVVRTEPQVARVNAMGQLQEVLRRYGIRMHQ